MQPLPYKDFQRLYDEFVQDHPDDFENMEIIEDPELVENALHYFKEATFPLIYPAKSYAVAIIYATKIEELYGIPIKETLNDPDLFLGHDQYFVPYELDRATYDTILERLNEMPDWINSGWAPQTVKYCLMECTQEGISTVLAGGG
ncbi:hypothetical protein D9M68_17740 [compost metagenome]